MKKTNVAIGFLLVLFLGACRSGAPPNVSLTQVEKSPDQWQTEQALVNNKAVSSDNWYQAFNDPHLEKLVLEAQAKNTDLQSTAADVQSALALARSAQGFLFPSINLVGDSSQSGALNHDSNTQRASKQSNYSGGLQLGWELDIWGRLDASKKASLANAEAAKEQFRFAKQLLAANVMRGYFLAIEANSRVGLLQQSVNNLSKILDMVELQSKEGFASPQDLQVTRSDLATAESNLIAAEGAHRDALRSLELLLDRYPSAELDLRKTLPDLPAAPPVGLPADILQQRPDLKAAQYNVNAAFNRAFEAKAARYPSISLTGTVGGASSELSNLFSAENMVWNSVTSLMMPLFQGGSIQAQIDSANAKQKAAIADYRTTTLAAFQEVETALDASNVLEKRNTALSKAVTASKEAYRIAKVRYDNGDIALLDLLSVEQRLFQAQTEFAGLLSAQLQEQVNLYLALGGDWKKENDEGG